MEQEYKPGFDTFIHWAFQALLLALVSWGVTELSGVNKSVQELNVKMAVVVERDQMRGEELKNLKSRVDRLEGINP